MAEWWIKIGLIMIDSNPRSDLAVLELCSGFARQELATLRAAAVPSKSMRQLAPGSAPARHHRDRRPTCSRPIASRQSYRSYSSHRIDDCFIYVRRFAHQRVCPAAVTGVGINRLDPLCCGLCLDLFQFIVALHFEDQVQGWLGLEPNNKIRDVIVLRHCENRGLRTPVRRSSRRRPQARSSR